MDELHGYYLEDLKVGLSASYAKTITEADVVLFAGITGDDNPVHLNADYAAGTQFGQRIVHGMFSAGLISAVLGTRLPGPGAIYVDQQLSFKAPVHIGDTVVATATVLEIDERRRRVKLETVCRVKDKIVAQGVATNMVDRRPSQ
ncbi:MULTISPECIES: MaoC family dehydratase [Alloalcanivorax]|jgi:3-hydroxybutyryl-CoA dehydratase|uniref:MaoC-like dehydratase n=3 Tax=Alloalcanivorax TaxID=3020832 RepID=K0CFU4_ALCDB|nr:MULTISPECIES: MaoC family dehydratase [Alloalcanivorax]ERS14154.1 MaoC family dehydratase [Alcanivorax sp. PN-3]PHS72469.1 MAG: acyl dehydratase [Alcanivorax sp.]AFT72379.1 MaoC-like dehydratase [Alloalcanivorax dieselolei B5]ARB47416.1 acyl dehydratase [Alloalcanivorax xenomutans]MCE7508136.1 MaoC family dehydratase [Alloalcanivorax xenomutans]|tara:strand:+ start:412 stop:846 length:435 start_codon:yes stop_codon:yes gene_type:complete